MKKFLKSLLAVMLIAIMALSFTSCGVPSDPAKAKENYEKNEYTCVDVTAIVKTVVALTGNAANDVKGAVWATKDEEVAVIVWTDSADLKKYLEENMNKIYEKVTGEKDTDGVSKGSTGACVYIGSDAAIKAAG